MLSVYYYNPNVHPKKNISNAVMNWQNIVSLKALNLLRKFTKQTFGLKRHAAWRMSRKEASGAKSVFT